VAVKLFWEGKMAGSQSAAFAFFPLVTFTMFPTQRFFSCRLPSPGANASGCLVITKQGLPICDSRPASTSRRGHNLKGGPRLQFVAGKSPPMALTSRNLLFPFIPSMRMGISLRLSFHPETCFRLSREDQAVRRYRSRRKTSPI
jgi:hypothetical protein